MSSRDPHAHSVSVSWRSALSLVAPLLAIAGAIASASAQSLHVHGVVQGAGHVAAGDTVRLFDHKSLVVRGILAGADSAGLVVVPDGSVDSLRYIFRQFDRAEVRRGQRRRGASAVLHGAEIGAIIGLVIGGAGVLIQSGQHEPGPGAVASIFLGIFSAVIGTAVGAVASLTYTDVWLPFDPLTLRVTQNAT
jgi:hypothetical protein